MVTPPSSTTLTDSTGHFQFTSLFSGNYLLFVDDTTLPKNLLPTYDSDGTGTPNSTYIYLPPNLSDDKEDFGYWYPESQIFLPIVDR
jgi:hypothetical protein